MFVRPVLLQKLEVATPSMGSETVFSDSNSENIQATREQVEQIVDFFLRYPELQKTFKFIVETRSSAQEIIDSISVMINDANEQRERPNEVMLKLVNIEALRGYVTSSIGTRMINKLPRA